MHEGYVQDMLVFGNLDLMFSVLATVSICTEITLYFPSYYSDMGIWKYFK